MKSRATLTADAKAELDALVNNEFRKRVLARAVETAQGGGEVGPEAVERAAREVLGQDRGALGYLISQIYQGLFSAWAWLLVGITLVAGAGLAILVHPVGDAGRFDAVAGIILLFGFVMALSSAAVAMASSSSTQHIGEIELHAFRRNLHEIRRAQASLLESQHRLDLLQRRLSELMTEFTHRNREGR